MPSAIGFIKAWAVVFLNELQIKQTSQALRERNFTMLQG